MAGDNHREKRESVWRKGKTYHKRKRDRNGLNEGKKRDKVT